MTEMKNCCRCHKDKASDESKDGHIPCITCLAKVAKYQKNNPEKMNAKCKRHHEKERGKLLPQKREKKTKRRYGVTVVEQKLEGMDGETI